MSIRYKIFDDRKLVYLIAEKNPTFDEQLRNLETLANDPRYVAPMKKLVDFTKINPIGLTKEEIELFTEKKAQYKEKLKTNKPLWS